ncbi:MAG: prepilin-type N-terminal cleavage/methylation domain-containing protein [Pseudomonadota bacterium]
MDRQLTSDPGFTLIELMISVAVVAALAATVTLSISAPGEDNRADWVTFRDLHQDLRQSAAISRQIAGLRVAPEGYQQLTWRGAWEPRGASVPWRGTATLMGPGGTERVIQFAPSGEATPVLIRFSGSATIRVCEANAWEAVACRGL